MKTLFVLPLVGLLFITSFLNAQHTSGSAVTVSRGTTSRPSRESIQEKIENLTKQIALDKNNAKLYSERSQEEYFNDFYDSAIADINKAIQLDTTKNLYFFIERGFLKDNINSKTHQNRYSEKEILSDFNLAISLSSQKEKASRYQSRAIHYSNIKMYNLAIADLDTAIMLDHNHNFTYFLTRARVKDESGSYSLTETLKDYERAIAFENNELKISPYLSRAKFYASKKMYPNAIADLDSALVYKENIRGGFCFRDRGDYKKQSKLYSDSSIQADYNMANTLDSLSRHGKH